MPTVLNGQVARSQINTLISSFILPSLLQNREPMMPSPQFIKSYFSSFTDDIISQPLLKGEKKDEDKDKEGEATEVTGRSGNIYLLNTEQEVA